MRNNRRHKRFWVWARQRLGARRNRLKPHRGSVDHVILLDGTNSTLIDGQETNIGLIYRLLADHGKASLYYEAGLQWEDLASTIDVAIGRGINLQIARAYGYLASRYRPGDRIFLMGFSRGAFAVRSLASLIDRVGLLTAQNATEREIRQVYRMYKEGAASGAAQHYRDRMCHPEVQIEMVGVFDTVKALGLRLPFFWRFSQPNHAFHDHRIGSIVRAGFHALAEDETRIAFEPVLWDTTDLPSGGARSAAAPIVEQVWFKGHHGDIGGPPRRAGSTRGRTNIALVWMLGKAEICGLNLPSGWRMRFPCDPTEPPGSGWHGWAKLFLLRRKRVIGKDPSEMRYDAPEAYVPFHRSKIAN